MHKILIRLKHICRIRSRGLVKDIQTWYTFWRIADSDIYWLEANLSPRGRADKPGFCWRITLPRIILYGSLSNR